MNKKRISIIFLLTAISLLLFSFAIRVHASDSNRLNRNLFSIQEQDNTLKFVQLTDVHTDIKRKNSTRRLFQNSRDFLSDAVGQINNIDNINFVIFTGDSINTPQEETLTAFSEIASQLKYPWYVVLGNHDVGVRSSFNKEKFYNILKNYNKYQNNNLPYYSFIPKKGYLVIVMDGVIDSKITAHGYFEKQQLNWLEDQLKNNKNSRVIIAQHFPLVEPSKSADHFVINKKEYMNILNKYNNVIAIISGHYHEAKITKIGRIVHISTPALVEYPNAFRVISITDKGNVLQMKIELKETNLKNLQNLSKSKSSSTELSYGKESDRNQIITISK